MSFRFASAFTSSLAADCFDATFSETDLAPSWNIRPGQHARAIRRVPGATRRRLDVLCWGLIPNYVKSGRHRRRLATIPAIQVTSSRITAAAFRSRRCLVPATALYEPGDRPTAIESNQRRIFTLGAVWDCWRHPSTGDFHESFAVITQGAASADAHGIAPLPLIVHPEHWSLWLGEQEGSPQGLLTLPSNEKWRRWAVSRRVFSTDSDDPNLLLPFDQLRPARECGDLEPGPAVTSDERAPPPRPCC